MTGQNMNGENKQNNHKDMPRFWALVESVRKDKTTDETKGNIKDNGKNKKQIHTETL